MAYDSCNECTAKGNLETCEATPCSKHDSWYVITLKEKIENERLQSCGNSTEHA